MEKIKVKDMMVPLTEFISISEDDSLVDAMLALEEAFILYGGRRAILVSGKNGEVVGKVTQLDAIRALEPKYNQMDKSRSMSRSGLSPKFISNMLKEFNLWNKPLDYLCQKALQVKVKQFMYTLGSGEYVEQDAPLNKAIHQLIIGSHQSLLVKKDDAIIGIIRLKDIFEEIIKRMKACKI